MPGLQWIEPDEVTYSQEAPTTVRRRALRLLKISKEFEGLHLDLDRLKLLRSAMVNCLSHPNVKTIAKTEISTLNGVPFTAQTRQRLCLSLAGGYRDARSGRLLNIFSTISDPVDCLGRVEDLRKSESDPRKVVVTFRICNSSMAGQTINSEFRLRSFSGWSKMLGMYDRRQGAYPRHLREWLRMECVLRVERSDSKLQLLGVSTTDKMLAGNRKLLLARFRKNNLCYFGAAGDCLDCGVGPNQCDRSCVTQKTQYKLKKVNDGRARRDSKNSH